MATDSFTNTNGTALETHDSTWIYNATEYEIRSNGVRMNGTGDTFAAWNGTFDPDQYSELTVASLVGANYVGVGVRIQDADSGYGFYGTGSTNDNWLVYMTPSGSWSQLGASAGSAAFATSDVIRISIESETITPTINGSTTGTPGAQTHSEYSSGLPGLFFAGGNNNARGDDWVGLDLAAGPVANGTPSMASPTASGVVTTFKRATGAATMAAVVAAGVGSFAHDADGTPTLDEITASGVATIIKRANGTPSMASPIAAGVVNIIKGASGAADMAVVTAAGTAGLLHDATGAPALDEATAAGTVTQTYMPSGTPSMAEITASGVAALGAITADGAPAMDVPTASGSVVQTYLPSGAATLDAITASGVATLGARTADGTPALEPITASGSVIQTYSVTGATTLEVITASGVASLGGLLPANGTPTAAVITASGAVVQTYQPSGAPSLDVITASGLVNVFGGTEGFPTLDVITASGVATLGALTASGTPTLDAITASGVAALGALPASGTPSLAEITASGVATLGARTASGTPSVEAITASGIAGLLHEASGTPALDAITASGVASLAGQITAFGTPALEPITAAGQVTQTQLLSGTPALEPITASGVASIGARISSGTTFGSAHHRELYVVPQSALSSGFVPPAPEKSVRYIQIVPFPDPTQHPYFVGVNARSILRAGVIEYSPVVTHYRWYDNDNIDTDLTTAIAAEDSLLGIEVFGASRHLRLAVENRGGDKRAVTYQLQAALNGGVWFNVDVGSGVTRSIAGLPADSDTTVARLTRVLPAASGEYDEVDGVVDVTHFAQRHVEFVFSVQFVDIDLETGDELAFRLREESAGYPARIITSLVNPRAAIGEISPDPIVVAAEDDLITVDAEAVACGETDANTITVAAENDTIIVDVDDDTVTVDA